MKRGDNIFVYGTLRPGASNGGTMSRGARHIGQDRIPGRLYDVSWFPGVKLDAAGDPQNWVTGDVFEIEDEGLPAELDRYEGYPDLYTREQVPTENGLTAWVYIINRDMSEDRRIEGGDWFAHIKKEELVA